jgi:hypothetical protein
MISRSDPSHPAVEVPSAAAEEARGGLLPVLLLVLVLVLVLVLLAAQQASAAPASTPLSRAGRRRLSPALPS